MKVDYFIQKSSFIQKKNTKIYKNTSMSINSNKNMGERVKMLKLAPFGKAFIGRPP